MGIFTPFTSPRDPRWQGAQHHHHTIFLAKNAILLFIIVVIIENILLKIWAADSYYEYKDEDTGPYSPSFFWLRISIALFPDILYTLATLALIFQIPALSLKGRTWAFHPAVALTFSIVMMCLYFGAALLNALLTLGDEYYLPDREVWLNIGYVELGFQIVLGLCYVGMIMCSCVAVHRWRVGQKGKPKRFVEVGEESELRSVTV